MTAEVLRDLDSIIRPLVFAYAFDLLPLVDHAPGKLADQFSALADWAGREPESGYAAWMEVPRWACWCLGQLLGVRAVRTRSFTAAGAVLKARMTTRYGGVEPLIDGVPGAFGSALADELVEPPSNGRKWVSNAWEYVCGLFEADTEFNRAISDVLGKNGDPKRAMGDWNFVHCLYLGLVGVRSAAFFSISDGGAREFAMRFRSDDQARAQLASGAFDIELADLDERAREALSRARSMGHFHDMDAVSLFLTGEA